MSYTALTVLGFSLIFLSTTLGSSLVFFFKREISEKLNTHGISNEVLIPTRKDWNEDILHSREVLCPTLRF